MNTASHSIHHISSRMLRRRATPRRRAAPSTPTPLPLEIAPSTAREIPTALTTLRRPTTSTTALILAPLVERTLTTLGHLTPLLHHQTLAADEVRVGGHGGVVCFGRLEVDEGAGLCA